MAKIELIKTKTGTYKFISYSNQKHPALVELGRLLSINNRISSIKIGIYNVGDARFTNKVKVYSYSSKKEERMTKKQFRKFLKGEKQIVQKEVDWNLSEEKFNLILENA